MSYSRRVATSSSKKSKRRAAKTVDMVREKLKSTGQMEVLYDLVDVQLTDNGWKDAVQDILREEINKGNNLTLEQLHDLVKDKSKNLITPEVRRQLSNEILKSYETPAPALDGRLTNGYNGRPKK